MTAPPNIVFLLDVDNTLLDNDQVTADLRGIARAQLLSQATIRNMRLNLVFAFVYNALGVPLAAGVLYPFTGWLLSPMIAAVAASLSSAYQTTVVPGWDDGVFRCSLINARCAIAHRR